MAITLLVMLGWKFEIDSLAQQFPGVAAMTFNTALGLCLSALSLLLLGLPGRTPRTTAWLRDAALLAAGLAGTLATLTIMEMLTGSGLGIDELFVMDWVAREHATLETPGRMSQSTAVAILLLGVALGLSAVSSGRRSLRWASIATALLAISLGIVAGGAMLLADDGLTTVPFFSTMAPHTSWIVVFLACGVVTIELAGHRTSAALRARSSSRVKGVWLTMTVVLVFAPGVSVSAMVAKQSSSRELRAAEARFERLSDRIVRETRRRVRLPVHGLNGVSGMYAGSESVTRAEFRAFVEQRDLEAEFPGTIGMGVIDRVASVDLAAFEASQRADDGLGYVVHPESAHAVRYPIKYIDPLESNLPAWGFDVGSEANRRAAVEEAIRTGQPILTRRITLVQDDTQQPGFLLLKAIYRNDAPIDTPAEREASLEGIAYVPMLIEGIFEGVVQEAEGGVEFAIYEGRGISPSRKLFEDRGIESASVRPTSTTLNRHARFSRTVEVDAVGQPWTIEMVSSPAFDAAAVSSQSSTVAVYGLILSSVASLFVWLLGCARADALELAESKTHDLQRITEHLQQSSEVIARQNVELGAMAERAHRVVDDVSHEFRTPLTVIKEFASIINDGLAGPVTEKQVEFLKIMSGAVGDLNHMVEDLLDSSKLRAGRLRVERRGHRVEDIFERGRATLARKASSRGITIEERVEDGLPEVFADEEKVRRVIANLMTNAIKFSPQNSVIRLSATRRDELGEVVIGVTDQGSGLSVEEIDSLFGRFHQTSAGRRATAKGFGLGLSIAEELSWLNLGRISVQSERGKGATFSFTVPYNQPEAILDHYFNTMASIERPEDQLVLLQVRAREHGNPQEVSSFLSSVSFPTDLLLPVHDDAQGRDTNSVSESWWILGRTMDVEAWKRRIHDARRQQIEDDGLNAPLLDFETVDSWSYPTELNEAMREIPLVLLGARSYGEARTHRR